MHVQQYSSSQRHRLLPPHRITPTVRPLVLTSRLHPQVTAPIALVRTTLTMSEPLAETATAMVSPTASPVLAVSAMPIARILRASYLVRRITTRAMSATRTMGLVRPTRLTLDAHLQPQLPRYRRLPLRRFRPRLPPRRFRPRLPPRRFRARLPPPIRRLPRRCRL